MRHERVREFLFVDAPRGCPAPLLSGHLVSPGEYVPAETHTQQGPLDRAALLDLIREHLGEILGRDPQEIGEQASFVDLGAEGGDVLDLVESVEAELGERTVGFRIDDEDLDDLETVRDALEYIVARLG